MAPKACTVTLTDVRGSRHSVDVVAESLYEAAVYGLKLLQENGWVENKPGPATRLEIRVKTPEVVHQVSVQQVARWLDWASPSPNEMVRNQKLKQVLGERLSSVP